MRKHRVASMLVAAAILVGCGADTGDDSQDVADDRHSEPTETQDDDAIDAPEDDDAAEMSDDVAAGGGWTEDDIEYKLAVVDEGGFVSTDDPVIDRYASALDEAEAVCPENRTMLADIAVRAVQILDEDAPGHSENALSMLSAISAAAGDDLGIECTEIAATLLVMIQGG